MEQEFAVKCHNCSGVVSNYTQNIHYTLTKNIAIQGTQTIFLSCGCVVDYPDWQVNLNTGECKIVDYTGKLYIEFLDEEMILEDEED